MDRRFFTGKKNKRRAVGPPKGQPYTTHTHHDVRLREIAVVRELAGPTREVAGRVRYADVAAVLRAEVLHVGRELEQVVVVGPNRLQPSVVARPSDHLVVHERARVIDVRFAQFLQVGQVEAHLFFGHRPVDSRRSARGTSSIGRTKCRCSRTWRSKVPWPADRRPGHGGAA